MKVATLTSLTRERTPRRWSRTPSAASTVTIRFAKRIIPCPWCIASRNYEFLIIKLTFLWPPHFRLLVCLSYSPFDHWYSSNWNDVDHNYVQARRVCYFLWLLAALLSAPTLVARVYVEVWKRQTLTLKQRHIPLLLIMGDEENKYRKSDVQFSLDWNHLKTLHISFFL